MENKTLKETAEILLNFDGMVKGESFRTHGEYIRYREGEEGVRRVEEKMAELGVPIKFKNIKPLQWYNEGKSSLIIVIAKEIFNWTEDDIYEMGRFSAKSSFIVKVLMRYFVSLEKVLSQAPVYWKKYCSFGEVQPIELNKKDQYILLRLKGFTMHPLVCTFYAGYFHGFAGMNIKSKKMRVEEVKCMSKGDPYHEYLIKWKN